MKLAVVMMTIDRGLVGRPNYVLDTLESFERSGLWSTKTPFELHLVEGGSPNLAYLNDWVKKVTALHVQFEGRLPPKNNCARALGIGASAEADWVLFCEDDINVCKDFLDSVAAWLERFSREDRRVVTFYTPYNEVVWALHKREPQWDYPVEKFYGTQCFAMRVGDAADCAEFLLNAEGHPEFTPSYDLIIKEWSAAKYPNLPFFQATVPSFVQHIGVESFLFGENRFHACQSFPGEDWKYA